MKFINERATAAPITGTTICSPSVAELGTIDGRAPTADWDMDVLRLDPVSITMTIMTQAGRIPGRGITQTLSADLKGADRIERQDGVRELGPNVELFVPAETWELGFTTPEAADVAFSNGILTVVSKHAKVAEVALMETKYSLMPADQ